MSYQNRLKNVPVTGVFPYMVKGHPCMTLTPPTRKKVDSANVPTKSYQNRLKNVKFTGVFPYKVKGHPGVTLTLPTR